MDLNALREKRGNLITQARAILSAAQGETLSAEDEQRFDALMAEADKLKGQIARGEQLEREEADAARSQHEPTRPDPAAPSGDTGTRTDPRSTDEYRQAFVRYLRSGNAGLRAADMRLLEGAVEARAMQAGSDVDGGYTVAPQQFVAQLIQAVDDAVIIRQRATTQTVDRAESLGVPTLATDIDDADWTSELATGNEGDLKFGKREWRPHPLAKRVKVSRKLLRQSSIDVEGLVLARLAYKFGVAQEKGFMTGNGQGRPLGLFTASNDGIPTSRDVVTGAATDFTADGLIDAKYGLKEQYRRTALWIFHRDGVKRIRKLKDGDGRYIWQPGLAADRPDTILDLPFVESEFAPNTFTTGKYVGLLGDLSHYWIADALDMTVQRLDELYAETNQVGFIGRLETDGMPVLAEAFIRLKTS
jgi:HK97 family phage major capsid protein